MYIIEIINELRKSNQMLEFAKFPQLAKKGDDIREIFVQ